jgi:hypothetical protein
MYVTREISQLFAYCIQTHLNRMLLDLRDADVQLLAQLCVVIGVN